MKRALTIAITASAGLVLMPGAAGAGQGPFAVEDCTKPEARPERIVIACGDFGLFVDSINWDNWGDRKATGHGALNANDCTPSCAEGDFKRYPVNMTVRKVRKRECGGKRVPLFTKLILSFPGSAPSFAGALQKNPIFCSKARARVACHTISFENVQYVFFRQNMKCGAAKDTARHLRRSHGDWEPGRFRCSSGTNFQSDGKLHASE
jgi:hypothetical protein